MVECDGLENRWTRKGLEGSNPSSSATKSQALLDLETTGNLSGEHSLYPNLSQSSNCLPQRSAKPPTQCGRLLPCSSSSACNRRQAPNGASKVSQRVLGARSPDIGTSQKNSAVEDFPVSSLGIHLVALCNRGDFGKEMTGNRAIGFRQAWAYMCCPKPLVRGRCGTRPDRSR